MYSDLLHLCICSYVPALVLPGIPFFYLPVDWAKHFTQFRWSELAIVVYPSSGLQLDTLAYFHQCFTRVFKHFVLS